MSTSTYHAHARVAAGGPIRARLLCARGSRPSPADALRSFGQRAFSVNAPPAPWVSLGWIENFTRKSTSKFGELVTGSPGATQFQVRETVDATVSFRFKAWSKLSMALAAGSQHMNLIVPAAGGAANGSGSKGVPPVNLATGSTRHFLALAASDAGGFAAGSLVTVDVDYAAQTGYVGSGVCAAYVTSAAAVNSDPDYIRRVSFNVARVASSSSTGLAARAAAHRRHSRGRHARAAHFRLRRSRRRQLLPGVVRALRRRRRAGRAHSLPLSAPAVDGRTGGERRPPSLRRSNASRSARPFARCQSPTPTTASRSSASAAFCPAP
jgi:hypothetical protein